MLTRTVGITILALIFSSPRSWAKDMWIEVNSPSFTVFSNGSEKQARTIARQFEQMRLLFAQGFPGLRLDSGAPIYVIAARDEDSMKELLPEFWKKRGRARPAGVFKRMWEKSYAVVRLDADREDSYHTVYHEYVHYLMSLNFRRLPLWLSEGIAEFYGNAQLREKEARVGMPSDMLSYMRPTNWIPLDKIIAVGPGSPYYTEEGRAGMFYAEAWLLTHFLVFGKNMNRGALLNDFNKLVQQGADDAEAFQKIFGDVKKIDRAVSSYASQQAFGGYIVKTDLSIQETDFTTIKLNDGQWNAFRSGFELAEDHLAKARPLLEQALAQDPKSGLANENMAFLLLHEGKDEQARVYFAKALENNPKRYLSLYYHSMLSLGNERSQLAYQQLDKKMNEVLELNPRFAPAFVALSLVRVRLGKFEQANVLAAQAAQLEPSRAGYLLNYARILARKGDIEAAERMARVVAERWYGPDRDEAMETLAALPGKAASSGSLISTVGNSHSADEKSVSGRIEGVDCSEAGREVRLRSGSELMKFKPGPLMIIGIPDTLWYGSDHFNFCHRLLGMKAVVRYKPSTGNFAGEITSFGIRDEFPEAEVTPGNVQVTER